MTALPATVLTDRFTRAVDYARIAHAAQYFRKSDGEPINNIGGFWIAEQVSLDPSAKVEADHELVWLHPHTALNELRHDAHAWAVATWLRRKA